MHIPGDPIQLIPVNWSPIPIHPVTSRWDSAFYLSFPKSTTKANPDTFFAINCPLNDFPEGFPISVDTKTHRYQIFMIADFLNDIKLFFHKAVDFDN